MNVGTEIAIVWWDRLPRLRDRVANAIGTLNESREACRHVAAGEAEVVLCAQHPGALHCKPCLREHIAETHDDAMEYECDGCGNHPPRITAVAFPTVMAGAVHTARGSDQDVGGAVVIGGLGLCQRCRIRLTGMTP